MFSFVWFVFLFVFSSVFQFSKLEEMRQEEDCRSPARMTSSLALLDEEVGDSSHVSDKISSMLESGFLWLFSSCLDMSSNIILLIILIPMLLIFSFINVALYVDSFSLFSFYF